MSKYLVSLIVCLLLSSTAHGSKFSRHDKGMTCYTEAGEVSYRAADPDVAAFRASDNSRASRSLERPAGLVQKESQVRSETGEEVITFERGGKEVQCFVRNSKPSLTCSLDETIVFSSQYADIKKFDALKRGFTLIHEGQTGTQDVYTYSPGPLVCVVDRTRQTASVRREG